MAADEAPRAGRREWVGLAIADIYGFMVAGALITMGARSATGSAAAGSS